MAVIAAKAAMAAKAGAAAAGRMKGAAGFTRRAAMLPGMVLILAAGNGSAQLARTPPMGFNTWNTFGCNVGQDTLQALADAIAGNGMKDAGYAYVNVDDCWEGARDADGFLGANGKWTGNALKAAADYVHGKGLKFGAYTSLGSKTCSNFPATQGYESQDVRQWVEWGLDYIKVDWCNVNATQSGNPEAAFKALGDTLRKYAGPNSARPILYSICDWGIGDPWIWGRNAGGQMWRTTGDITADWGSITGIIDKQAGLYAYAGAAAPGQPGGWNDPDMLEVGRGSLTDDENRAHFGMWCLLAAPLIAGNDVRKMTAAVRDILLNKDVIAVDQDSLGIQAQRISSANGLEVWARPLQGNARAVGLFNRSGSPALITVNWSDLDKWASAGKWSATTEADVRDLWAKSGLETRKTGAFGATVPSHGLAMLMLTPSGSVSLAPRNPERGFGYGSHRSNRPWVDLPGANGLRILDLQGRVLAEIPMH
jgi:alpha-galactosidase